MHQQASPQDVIGIRARLDALTLRDEREFSRRLERARRDPGRMDALVRALVAAEERVERRRLSVPQIRYPSELPITERADEIRDAIERNPVVVVAGETGSGKSTQLPKICLEAGLGVRGMIGHTQPRRIAARAVAERVAEELDTTIGSLVGFTVRFADRAGPNTLIRVMTDGILLAELQRDRDLYRYDTIIVDEAHERSLNIDFILGYLKQLLPRRPGLKIIVTSATIDTERFARHFDGAPVVEVSGRTYPVEVRYRPPSEETDQPQAICEAVEELWTEGPGDILVFLSGEREIRDAAESLNALRLPDTEILPLFARLSAAEQHRVFEPHPGRRVVLATNVAETSLTVPGVRYVVDPGTARISRYSHRTKVQRLPIEPVSQASANQRAGRCGRVAPGICIRLYDEEDFGARPAFTEPEILRTNLASVVLQMAALGLGDIAAFPFVEPPDRRNIADGVALLGELGALDRDQALTPLGRKLARLPLDPRLARMVLEAGRNGCVREVTIIAAALEINDPRERPADRRQAADEMHARFADPTSDFLTYLKLWAYIEQRQSELSSSRFRKLCKAEFLHFLRVREWQDVVGQLRDAAKELGTGINRKPADPKRIHMSLLAGLLSHIGFRDGPRMDLLGARGARFSISPGSALFKKPPKWVMAAELVETTKLWAHTVARIQPEWAERLAPPHVLKRSYDEPWWDDTRASAVANETVRLYGLPIVAARKVDFGRIDAGTARELFITHALVRGEWRTTHAFMRRNRAVLDEVRALEDRVRRRHIVMDDDALFDFYEQRIGTDVVSGSSFDEWFATVDPSVLELTPEIALGTARISEDDYPLEWHGFRTTYVFEPGAPDDGVTVHVPLAALNRVDADAFAWQVPGLREELVAALIRSLPKDVRRRFVSPQDQARSFLEHVTPDDGPLRGALAAWLNVPASAFAVERIPPHLRVTYRVDDLGSSKDLEELRGRLHGELWREAVAEAGGIERSGMTDWDAGALPRVIDTPNGLRAYPALTDEGASVAVRLYPSVAEQERAMVAGTRRLVLLTVGRDLGRVVRTAPGPDLLDACVAAATDRLVDDHGGVAWDEPSFRALQEKIRPWLVDLIEEVAAFAEELLTLAASLEATLRTARIPPGASADVREQLGRLVRPSFFLAVGGRRITDVVRYLRAIERRLAKLPDDPARDDELMRRVRALEREAAGIDAGELPWMLEELRVSLFAQQLRTAYPVSEERIRREIERLRTG